MKLRRTILCSLALALTSLPSAFACEWHGGGNYGYGFDSFSQNWLPYSDETSTNESQSDRQYSTMTDPIDETAQNGEQTRISERPPQPPARPSFSSSATRASNAAKERIEQNVALDSTQRSSTTSR